MSDVPAGCAGALDDGDLASVAGRVAADRRRHGAAMVAGALAGAALVTAAALWTIGRVGGAAPLSRPVRAARVAPAVAALDASPLAARAEPASLEDAVPSPPAPPRPAPVLRRKGLTITRADRGLLDLLARKDDVTVIPPADAALDGAQGTLDPGAVSRTVERHRKAFDACVSRALRLAPTAKVAPRATLVLTVKASGGVAGAFVAEEDVDRSALGACLSAAARRIAFPAFEGEPVDVSMPLALSAVL